MFTFSGKTALQSNRSLDSTLVREIPPIYPFTGVPVSSSAIIRLITVTTTESVAVHPLAAVAVTV